MPFSPKAPGTAHNHPTHGRADTREDANANGVVDTGESDANNPNMDGDTLLDGHDNCLFTDNENQRDSDEDGYGNRCDADFDNNNRIDFADLAYMKLKFFTDDADADLNGACIWGFLLDSDLLISRSASDHFTQ